MTEEQLLGDYEEYYAYMRDKCSGLGYEYSAGVYQDILDLLHESGDFNDFQQKFMENNLTVEIGKGKIIDEAHIRMKAYRDAMVHVRSPYWVSDESYIRYEEDEKMQDTARVEWQSKVLEEAKNAGNLGALTSAMTSVNQQQALQVAADATYKTFDVDILCFNAIWMFRNAEVSDDPSIYPGTLDGDVEVIDMLETEEPKTYAELMALYQMEMEYNYQDIRKEVDTHLQATANFKYDYDQLWEPRNRRNYPVKDETLEKMIRESMEIREKQVKGGPLCR